VKFLSRVMELTTAYRLWQAPFADAKLEPVWRHNDLSRVRRVLDVGCGPGTNARHFARVDYLGLDVNPAYVEYARRRFGRHFIAADVRDFQAPPGARFDFILVNSLFHHIDREGTRRVLSQLSTLLTDDGYIHILDLVMPQDRGLARALARWDRGDYPRPLEDWRAMFSESFQPVLFEPYPLKLVGTTLWNMIYFKGRRRS
jgi:SAM-dependent methyltransferase